MTIALLITGATGRQGGAVINSLIAEDADVEIVAVARNVQSAPAKQLAKKSTKIKVIEGDLDHPAEIFRCTKKVAAQPIWGVFSVQIPTGKPETEERQGKSLIDESIRHHVKYFVYASVDRGGAASTKTPTPIPHFTSKHHIEQHLFEKSRSASMDWTVLRPVFFFDDIVPGFMGKLLATAWDEYLQGKPLQGVAISDVGYFAARAFLRPEEWRNSCFSVAGEELTYKQMQKKVKAKTGSELPTMYRVVLMVVMLLVRDLRVMFKWFFEYGFRADIAQVRRVYPGLKDFDAWLEESQFVKKEQQGG